MHDFYYLKLKNGESKPLVLYQIRALCKNGILSRDILFRYDGSDKWIPLSELLGDGLFDDGFIVQYYIKATPSDKGPFTLIQLHQILADGEISCDDLYRTNTIKDWHKVSEFEDLRLTECELVAQRAELYKPSERNDTTATYEEQAGSNRETKSNAKSGCLIAILSILCIGVVGALFDECTGSNRSYERSYEQTNSQWKRTQRGYLASVSREAFDRSQRYLSSNDQAALSKLLASGLVFDLKSGLDVEIVEIHTLQGVVKIRPKGENLEIWTNVEAVGN